MGVYSRVESNTVRKVFIIQMWLYKGISPIVICSATNKGQLISMSFWYLIFSQKTNKKIQFYYYGTTSRIVFVRFLGELKTPKWHFEINWPIVTLWVPNQKYLNIPKPTQTQNMGLGITLGYIHFGYPFLTLLVTVSIVFTSSSSFQSFKLNKL